MLDAKNRLSELVKSAQAGEDVVIANRGEPVARLVPVRKRKGGVRRRSGTVVIVEWLANHPLPAHAARSQVEIDCAISAERSGWD
jgi:prevent-host-death family protein